MRSFPRAALLCCVLCFQKKELYHNSPNRRFHSVFLFSTFQTKERECVQRRISFPSFLTKEMRSRSSKQQIKKGDMEVEKLSKLKQEPHLSGAYIRNLVKQLTSTRPKDHPMSPKSSDIADGDGLSPANHSKLSDGFSETQHTHQPQQPKKQVRRRLHTSRPYQERLLNMAEARREIVTALKFHRASMKQAANEQQHHHEQSQSLHPPLAPPPPPPLTSLVEHEENIRNPVSYPSNYLDNYLSYVPFNCPPPNPFPWASSLAPIPIGDNLNLSLPNQPLGLNLNFQDFNNLDTTIYYHNNNNNSSSYLYPSPASSSSPTLSSTEDYSFHSVTLPPEEPNIIMADVTNGGLHLHPALDDEEMGEIRSIGEQHEMEWNDRLNLVKSARWFKFLKKMENGPDDDKLEENGEEAEDEFHMCGEVMEFPAWLNPNESLQQHLDYDYYSKDFMQEPSLPCMDIGEIEGMDAEWLA